MFSSRGWAPMGATFNDCSDQKFITLMIQAVSMFGFVWVCLGFLSRGCCKEPEVSIELQSLGSLKSSFLPVLYQ